MSWPPLRRAPAAEFVWHRRGGGGGWSNSAFVDDGLMPLVRDSVHRNHRHRSDHARSEIVATDIFSPFVTPPTKHCRKADDQGHSPSSRTSKCVGNYSILELKHNQTVLQRYFCASQGRAHDDEFNMSDATRRSMRYIGWWNQKALHPQGNRQ